MCATKDAALPLTKMKKTHSSLSRFPASWRELLGFVAVATSFYQLNYISNIESALHLQESKIAELERILSANLPSYMSGEAKPAGNLSSAQPALVEPVHAPHSHYAIEMIDGVPVNPEKEYLMADFESIFHVEPIWEVEETTEAKLWLDKNDVWSEQYYLDNFRDIAPLNSKVRIFFETLEHKDDNRVYVKWESKETGFGLFAREPFVRGDIVGLYTGILYADWEHLNQDIDTDYSWDYPSETGFYPTGITFGVDGRKKGNYLRFANHAGDKSNTNAFFIPYNNRWNVFYVAIKDISPGEAITADYGSNYFEGRPLH